MSNKPRRCSTSSCKICHFTATTGTEDRAKPINSHGFNSDRLIGLAVVLATLLPTAATGTGGQESQTNQQSRVHFRPLNRVSNGSCGIRTSVATSTGKWKQINKSCFISDRLIRLAVISMAWSSYDLVPFLAYPVLTGPGHIRLQDCVHAT